MKRFGVLCFCLTWGLLGNVAVADNPTPTLPPSPNINIPAPSPRLPPPAVTPIGPSRPQSLFSSLIIIAAPDELQGIDQALESLWQQARELDPDEPDFVAQVIALQQTAAQLQQQYRVQNDPWGVLKSKEVTLKLQYLNCQDQQAIETAQAGLAQADATESRRTFTTWSNLLSQIYWALGQPEQSLEIKEALFDRLRQQLGRLSAEEAFDLVELGRIYTHLGQIDAAIAAYEAAIDSAYQPPHERTLDNYYAWAYTSITTAIENLIALNESLGDQQQVDYWTQRQTTAAQIYQQNQHAQSLMQGWYKGRFSEAAFNLFDQIATQEPLPVSEQQAQIEDALQLFRTVGDGWGELEAWAALSTIHLAQQNYRNAITIGETALALADTLVDPGTHQTVTQTLIQAHQALNQADQAQAVQHNHDQWMADLVALPSRPRFLYAFVSLSTTNLPPVFSQPRSCESIQYSGA